MSNSRNSSIDTRDIRGICIVAVGIALFVALSLCVQVPIFENYYICLGYLVMLVYLYKFGPLAGTIVGVFGVIFYCLLTSGLRGMLGWMIGNLVIGMNLGCILGFTKNNKKHIFYILNILGIVLSVIIGILVVKSFVECILYNQPIFVRIAKNIYACIADIVVLILGLPFCFIIDKADSKRTA